ncbi:MAG: hypothetical protein VX951_07015 [Planctomycetota bacterium]|nr:hypothetical protein [Planctomycetota bacterium]
MPGISLIALGAGFLVMAFLTSHGGPLFGDTKLDSGASTTRGTVTVAESHGNKVTRLEFRFQPPGGLERTGESFAAGSANIEPQQSIDVEYWADDPSINRISGTDAMHLEGELSILSNTFLIVGLLCSALWLRSAIKMRVTLRDGDCVEAQIVELKELLFINPSQLRVRYRFRDNEGHEFVHSHWLRHSCKFAKGLLADKPRTVSVIHDRIDPRISRAVTPGDFSVDETSQRRLV